VEEVRNKSIEYIRSNRKPVNAEDEIWVAKEGDWILALRTDKKKLDIVPRVWDGPFKVVATTNQLVDVVDIAGNRSLIPVSNTKPYRPEAQEDIEETELIMFNATNEGEPYFIVNRVTDHLPKHDINMGNLRLQIVYKGYSKADWYDARYNRDLLKTEAFRNYIEKFGELAKFGSH